MRRSWKWLGLLLLVGLAWLLALDAQREFPPPETPGAGAGTSRTRIDPPMAMESSLREPAWCTATGAFVVDGAELLTGVETRLSLNGVDLTGIIDERSGSFRFEGCPPFASGRLVTTGPCVERVETAVVTGEAGEVHVLPPIHLPAALRLRFRIQIDGDVGGWLGNTPPLAMVMALERGEQKTVPIEPMNAVFELTTKQIDSRRLTISLRIPGRFPLTLCERMTSFSRERACLTADDISLVRTTVVLGSVVDAYGQPLSGAEVRFADDTDVRSKRRFSCLDDHRFLLPCFDRVQPSIVGEFWRFHSSPVQWNGEPVVVAVDTGRAVRVQLVRADGDPVEVFGCARGPLGQRPQPIGRNGFTRRANKGVQTLKSEQLEARGWLYFWGPDFADFRVPIERPVVGGENPWVVVLRDQPVAALMVRFDRGSSASIHLHEIDARGGRVDGGWSYFVAPSTEPRKEVSIEGLPIGRYRCSVNEDRRPAATADVDVPPEGAHTLLVLESR